MKHLQESRPVAKALEHFAADACESGWWEFEQWEWETAALLVGATLFRWNAPAPA